MDQWLHQVNINSIILFKSIDYLEIDGDDDEASGIDILDPTVTTWNALATYEDHFQQPPSMSSCSSQPSSSSTQPILFSPEISPRMVHTPPPPPRTLPRLRLAGGPRIRMPALHLSSGRSSPSVPPLGSGRNSPFASPRGSPSPQLGTPNQATPNPELEQVERVLIINQDGVTTVPMRLGMTGRRGCSTRDCLG